MKHYRVVRKDNGPTAPHTGIIAECDTREDAVRRYHALTPRHEIGSFTRLINPHVVQEFDGIEWRNLLPGEYDVPKGQ